MKKALKILVLVFMCVALGCAMLPVNDTPVVVKAPEDCKYHGWIINEAGNDVFVSMAKKTHSGEWMIIFEGMIKPFTPQKVGIDPGEFQIYMYDPATNVEDWLTGVVLTEETLAEKKAQGLVPYWHILPPKGSLNDARIQLRNTLATLAGDELISPEKTYTLRFVNKTGMIVDIAIVDGDTGDFITGEMLSDGETWEAALPAGHYHIFAACKFGIMQECMLLPESLPKPDEPFTFEFHPPRTGPMPPLNPTDST